MMHHLWNSTPELMFEQLTDLILLLFCARFVIRINTPTFHCLWTSTNSILQNHEKNFNITSFYV